MIVLAVFLRPFAPFLVELLFDTWPSHQQGVLLSIIRSPGVLLSCLTMAQEEMKTVLMPDEHFLRQHSAKFWLYYGVQDQWVGAERERIVNILENPGGLRIVHCKHGIPHDFCICESLKRVQPHGAITHTATCLFTFQKHASVHGEILAEQCGAWLENGDLI